MDLRWTCFQKVRLNGKVSVVCTFKKRSYPLLVILIGAMLFLGSCSNTPGSSPTTSAAASRNHLWVEDIDELVARFPHLQMDGPRLIAAAGWMVSASQLKADVPHLTDAQIETRLMAMVARLGIAHDRLIAPDLTTNTYALRSPLIWPITWLSTMLTG